MFQRLTSLFFSNSNMPEGLEEPKPFVEEEEEEDGWLIIDLAAGAAAARETSCASAPGWDPGTAPARGDSPRSWFVTPPPCFTAEGPGPGGVGSSPMEDLLIEHPSMSVYITSTLEGAAGPPDPPPAAADGPFLHREVPEPRLERHMPHHSRSLSVKAAILEKVGQVRRVQRAKQLVEKHQLSQKALQRQNRAHQRPLRGAKKQSTVPAPCRSPWLRGQR
uniref:Tumor protein p53 inducible nuclear protein 2 n=1 Tax=Buteo japonicus TaxID=224669 RepID=A0A8C0BJS8_9AVES